MSSVETLSSRTGAATTKPEEYDLVMLGSGTGSKVLAWTFAEQGQRVATIDLDCRQQSFTRYINNRSAWARRTGLDLELPAHCCIKLGQTMQIADNENSE